MRKLLSSFSCTAVILLMIVALFFGCAENKQQTINPPEDIQVSIDVSDGAIPSGHESLADDGGVYPNAERLREEISTMDEAVKYLDGRFPELWMSMHFNNGQDDICWLRSGAQILEDKELNEAGRSCIASAAAYLLSDDMEVYTIIAFWSDGSGGCPLKAINCIKTEDGFEFIDAAKRMSGDEMSRYGALLPEGRYSSVEEYISEVIADTELAEGMYSIYAFENGEKFIFTVREEDGWTDMIFPQVEPLYVNEENHLTDEQLEEMLYGHIKPENIGSYQLSQMLGGVTLTADEAHALVDASPEEIKEKVKTAGDVLMYMLAARIGDCGGCKCDEWDGYTWHTNLTAKEVMEQRQANCGASANLANYLLEGDYDEVGIILHAYYPGNGGGHVYNYFLYEGRYYIVDLSWYIFAHYDASNDFPVMVLDSLEEYGQRVHELYGGVSLVICHTSTGQHLPNIFGEDFGDNHYYVPEDAEYTVLYESGGGYLIGEMPLNKEHHDWNVFW